VKTTQNIQWKRLAAEVIAIFASILFAFAIDAWWDERSGSLRLEGAIQNIAAEVAEARIETNFASMV
jgi:hypothetical protein